MKQTADPPPESPLLDAERRELLGRLEDWLETPMLVLGFVWLALLILEFTRGLSPGLEAAGTIIWVVFILDFALKLALAPDKSDGSVAKNSLSPNILRCMDSSKRNLLRPKYFLQHYLNPSRV